MSMNNSVSLHCLQRIRACRSSGIDLMKMIIIHSLKHIQMNSKERPAAIAANPLLAADYTGYFDDNGDPIYVGQKLKSEWNYEVIVCKSDDGSFYGQLVCDDKHSCKNIPYALNDGMGHTICG